MIKLRWNMHFQSCDAIDIYSGTYVSSVRCMYTSASGNIVDCIEFIYDIYTDIVVSCAHELIGICGIWGAYLLLAHVKL